MLTETQLKAEIAKEEDYLKMAHAKVIEHANSDRPNAGHSFSSWCKVQEQSAIRLATLQGVLNGKANR